MNFKDWLKIEERTVYHGTIIDNEPTIKQFGLVGGFRGPIGAFVRHHYDDDKSTEDDEVVFASDKKTLRKSVTAMTFHISQKLGKDFYDVSDNDIRNHGLLVIIKDHNDDPYNPNKHQDSVPRGVERGDYYAPAFKGDLFLKGAALIRFLRNNGEWPRKLPFANPNPSNITKGRLIARDISQGKNKSDVLKKHLK